MKFINRIFAVVMLACALCGMRAGNTMVIARLDSAQLLMGKTTALHLEIVQDKGKIGIFPLEQSDTLSSAIEIAGKTVPDTVDLGNGRIQINRDLILQAFDSGMYVVKPIPFIVNGDTAMSKPLTLKVMPVKVDEKQDIHGFKPVIEPPFKFFDWVPDVLIDYWWAFLLAFLLVGGGLCYYFLWYKKGRKFVMPGRKRLPPYEEAMINLNRLKESNLWQNGQEKEYFTGLTDILRVYIDRRFEINAVEMTSTQIIDTLKKNDETRAVNEQLSMILEMADVVKFANVRPLADDNEMAFKRAVNFIEATKPLPVADAKGKKGGRGNA
ncbi:cell wall anchor protein [Sodaliphilus sp.]|uniref:cell wall anchor protein n=1 Tax=Sodaliphilus sp. TaxID=2815818 RepID=UPI00388E57B2